jgi:hypothetical protein
MTEEKPVGKPYSQVYIERGVPVDDSARFRNRLRSHLTHLPDGYRGLIATLIEKKTGARVFYGNIARHFTECSLPDLLDNITHAFAALKTVTIPGGERPHIAWLASVKECLEEEKLAYVLDTQCGVHPAFDDEFDATRRATIATLDKPRYAAALKFFDEAMQDLKQPRDTRDAVRKTFEAVENVAKLMESKIVRLGAAEVKSVLQPILLEKLTGTERRATGRMIESLAEWVNACQQYRHAAGEPEPDEPSLDLAILMVSTGAAHLRWLIAMDRRKVA